jgi:hypothetical protein
MNLMKKLDKWCDSHPWSVFLIALTMLVIASWNDLLTIFHYLKGLK